MRPGFFLFLLHHWYFINHSFVLMTFLVCVLIASVFGSNHFIFSDWAARSESTQSWLRADRLFFLTAVFVYSFVQLQLRQLLLKVAGQKLRDWWVACTPRRPVRSPPNQLLRTFKHCKCTSKKNLRTILCICIARIRLPTLALKPRVDITRSSKQGYQWPHKKDLLVCPLKNFS